MPRRKGLGRDINKSLEIMADLQKCLKGFIDMPLKKGLQSVKISDEKLLKDVHNAMTAAFELQGAVEDLQSTVGALNISNMNSRFARRVLTRFIEGN